MFIKNIQIFNSLIKIWGDITNQNQIESNHISIEYTTYKSIKNNKNKLKKIQFKQKPWRGTHIAYENTLDWYLTDP